MARTAAAIELARAAGVRVEAADAPAGSRRGWPSRGRGGRTWSTTASSGSTSARQAQDARPREPRGGRGAGDAPQAPLAWLRMEGDGAEPGAAIALTLWPGGRTRLLGRADFHGAGCGGKAGRD